MRTESGTNDAYDFPTTNNVSPRLEHAVWGMVTEAGELGDAIKRAKVYGADLDVTNLIEEVGDLFWYLALFADELDVTFEEIWDKNVRKLQARFPEGFKSDDALSRDLEVERNELEN